jgi:hypothetical protein
MNAIYHEIIFTDFDGAIPMADREYFFLKTMLTKIGYCYRPKEPKPIGSVTSLMKPFIA